MSSNIKVQRICQHCGKEFTAKTTVTKYCGQKCASKAYKARERTTKVEASEKETVAIKTQPIEEIKAKEFLRVKEAAQLLGYSVRTTYRLIESGKLKAVNPSERLTRLKRTEIDRLLDQPIKPLTTQTTDFEILEGYHLKGIQEKFGISEKALYELVKRENIPKQKKGKYTYLHKDMIDKLLS